MEMISVNGIVDYLTCHCSHLPLSFHLFPFAEVMCARKYGRRAAYIVGLDILVLWIFIFRCFMVLEVENVSNISCDN